jgi:biotin carboxyl carrier protein
MAQFQLRIGDELREFDVSRQGDQLHVSSGDLSAEVRILFRDGASTLIEIRRTDGSHRRVRLVGARTGDARRLWVDGRALSVDRVRRSSAARGPDAGSLAAAIPAVVSQILVAVGDSVAPGDKLILLESMKMVIPIQAPHAGRVARILCAPGESVPAGVALLEIEPE